MRVSGVRCRALGAGCQVLRFAVCRLLAECPRLSNTCPLNSGEATPFFFYTERLFSLSFSTSHERMHLMFRISEDSPAYYITSVTKGRLPVFRTTAIKTVACSGLDEGHLAN